MKHHKTKQAIGMAPADIGTPTTVDAARITAEAQKDAFFYESVNDACPYPFATLEGATYKAAFIAARQVMNYGRETA